MPTVLKEMLKSVIYLEQAFISEVLELIYFKMVSFFSMSVMFGRYFKIMSVSVTNMTINVI